MLSHRCKHLVTLARNNAKWYDTIEVLLSSATSLSPLSYGVFMRIDNMQEGSLYLIKPNVYINDTGYASHRSNYRVLRGWKDHEHSVQYPPFVYLGWKVEDWLYAYQHTNKIHYVMWQGDIFVMDNQFAKHIIPSWDGDKDG